MKKFSIIHMICILSFLLSSCRAIGGIFKTGVGVGIFIVIAVIIIILFIVRGATKK